MTRLIVSTYGRLMGNTMKKTSCYPWCLKRLSTPQSTFSMNMRTKPLARFGVSNPLQERRNFSVSSGVQPGTPPPGNSSLGKWILGIIITVIVPFVTNKWTKFLYFKDKVETVIVETEKVAERVEDAAEAVVEIAKDVAEQLPEGGKQKDVVVFVEDVAKEIAKDAHLVESVIDQVEKVEDKVDSIVTQHNNNKKTNDAS